MNVTDPIVLAKVKIELARLASVPADNISSSSDIKRLGIDSLMSLEAVTNLEREFKVHIPEGKIRSLRKVNDIVRLLVNLRKELPVRGSQGISRRISPLQKREKSRK